MALKKLFLARPQEKGFTLSSSTENFGCEVLDTAVGFILDSC